MATKRKRPATKHERPSDIVIRTVIRRATNLVNKEPDDESAGYRRGLRDALKWVLGANIQFHKADK